MRKRILGFLSVPILALGLAPVSASADGTGAIWKVVAGNSAELSNRGSSAEVHLTITCPETAHNVVVDVTVSSVTASGEAESVPVACKGEPYGKDVTVTPAVVGPAVLGGGGGGAHFTKGSAKVKAVLDQAANLGLGAPVIGPGFFQEGTDRATDVRNIRLGDTDAPLLGVNIRHADIRSDDGKKVDVRVDYQCARGTESRRSRTLQVFVDQDLGYIGLGSTPSFASGDAEGVARKTVRCTGERETTTVTVTAGKGTGQGSAPCEQNSPLTTEGAPTYTPEAGGKFKVGGACVQAQFNELSSDPLAQQEGVFGLSE